MQISAMQLENELRNMSNGESVLRKVAAQWKFSDASRALKAWASRAAHETALVRRARSATSIILRMLAKSKMAELVGAYEEWRDCALLHFKAQRMQSRGAGVLQRTRARMNRMELEGALGSWNQRMRREVVGELRAQVAHLSALSEQLEESLVNVAFRGGEKILKTVGARWKNQDVLAALMEWLGNVTSWHNERRAERKMRQVAGRMMNRDAVEAIKRWRTNAAKGMAQMRRIMFNVVQRIKHREVAAGIVSWRMQWEAAVAQAKGEAVMRRVGMRWRYRDVSDRLRQWAQNLKGFKEGEWKLRAMRLEKDVADLQQALDFLAHEQNLNHRNIIRGIAKEKIRIKPWTSLDF